MAEKQPPAAAGPTWTPQQAEAIAHRAGDLLVSAAAGSGKTAVLSERCARLVTEGEEPVDVDGLLVLTFTEAAATEMRGRIARALRERVAELQKKNQTAPARLLRQAAMVERAAISTLHAFCGRVLRAYFHEAGVDPAFEIMDADEAALLRDETLQAVLARWHALGEKDPDGAAFAELLESHAQGREGSLADVVTSVHEMLASVKDPAAWLIGARQAYAQPADMLRMYAHVAAEKVADVGQRAALAASQLARHDGTEQMAGALEGFAELCMTIAEGLHAKGMGAWAAAGEALREVKWERINTPKDVDKSWWESLKKRTYQKAKDGRNALLAEDFAQRQTVEQMAADMAACAGTLDVLLKLVADFQQAYTEAKRQQNVLDFADLERLTLDLLQKDHSTAAADLRRRFDHVLVDEFQDINPLQAALLEAIRSADKGGGRGNLFVVGDVKQSIYAFRLADPGLFLKLEADWRKRASHKAFVALQNNFRSNPALLGAMNTVFERLLTPGVAGIAYAADHALHPPPGAPADGWQDAEGRSLPGAPIEFDVVLTDAPETDENAEEEASGSGHDGGDGEEGETERPSPAAEMGALELEAVHVARRIGALMASGRTVRQKDGSYRPLRYRDICILLRGVRSRAPLFVRALADAGIPVHAELSTGYFDAEEVRQTLALLAVLDNPFQDIPLATAMLSPYGRFTPDDLARIRLEFKRSEVPFHLAVHRYVNEGPQTDDGRALAARLQAFLQTVDLYRQRTRVLPLHEALAEIYQHSRMLVYVSGLAGGGGPQQRIANLQALHHRAQQFAGFRKQGLHRFLRFIERLQEREVDFGEAAVLSEAADVVRIMTIHKSKGLEFPVVFASSLGCRFQTDSSAPVVVSRDFHIGLQLADVPRNVYLNTAASRVIVHHARRSGRAEELRLLYVAMTRARDHLILTGAMKRNAFERLREAWEGHVGALPDCALLGAQNALDMLVPLAASQDAAGAFALNAVERDRAAEQAAAAQESTPPDSPLVRGQPLQAFPLADPAVVALMERVRGRYAHDALARLNALFSVTDLKKHYTLQTPEEDAADEELTAALRGAGEPREKAALPVPSFAAVGGDARKGITTSDTDPRARGIVTHRCLQLLDFATVGDGDDAALEAHIAAMTSRKQISEAQAALIHRDDILWFLSTDLAKRLRHVAQLHRKAQREQLSLLAAADAGDGPRLLKEVPFSYLLPADIVAALTGLSVEEVTACGPMDRPQLRGVVDLLVAAPEYAEIIDYKTDSPRNIQNVLADYKRQMFCYTRAAADILRKPVPRATLVFLRARKIHVIDNPGELAGG